MDKKRMILASLASAAVLGAGFVASQPALVRAEDAPQAVEKSSSEKKYDEAKAKADAAKKDYEEAKKKAEDAQKKYDEGQKQTEEKAENEKKAAADLNEATEVHQKAYVRYFEIQRAKDSKEYKNNRDKYNKDLAEADQKIKDTKTVLDEKQSKFNAVRAVVIPEATALAATKQKAEEAKKQEKEAETKLEEAQKEEEVAKKEVEAEKKEAEAKEELKNFLNKVEEATIAEINNSDKIKPEDKPKAIEKAKEAIGKEYVLKAIENGELSATDLLADVNKAAEAPVLTEEDEKKDNLPNSTRQDGKSLTDLPKDIQDGIKKGEENDAARPASEKAQDRADDLGDAVAKQQKEVDALNKETANKQQIAVAVKAALEKAKETLKATEEANADPAIIEGAKAAVEKLSQAEMKANSDFQEAGRSLEQEVSILNELIDLYNKALEEVKEEKAKEKTDDQRAEEDYARKSEEAYNRLTQQQPPKPAETPAQPEQPAKPAPAPKPEQPAKPEQPSYYTYYNSSTFYSAPKAEEKPKVTTGWKQENGVWYFYKEDGTMATGWIQTGGKWYYLGTDGMMQTGWAKVNGSWYYLNTNGAMATGWVKDGDTWYYLGVTGAMATGWLKDGDTWYYLEASGAMKASQWFKVSDKWYYVNGSGALAVNTTVDGYTVNENGEWVN